MQDPTQRGATITNQLLQDVAPIARSAENAHAGGTDGNRLPSCFSRSSQGRRSYSQRTTGGEMFQSLEQAIDAYTVDITAPGNIALDIATMPPRAAPCG